MHTIEQNVRHYDCIDCAHGKGWRSVVPIEDNNTTRLSVIETSLCVASAATCNNVRCIGEWREYFDSEGSVTKLKNKAKLLLIFF